MNKHYQKWDEYAPRGLLLVGFGLSVLGSAIISRAQGKGFFNWFFKGLIGLIATNAGLSIFAEAVKERTLYELDVQALREREAEKQI
ncbi:MAG: hypothetical protein Kow00117_00740 [Phototrophicales bacterium]|nr:MAG: hypothetical protein CUN56_12580 [Phototrophicales bacterium]RMG74104.1 MAG: hypothetical protein D6711_09555 [Chloroflexota bacterium]